MGKNFLLLFFLLFMLGSCLQHKEKDSDSEVNLKRKSFESLNVLNAFQETFSPATNKQTGIINYPAYYGGMYIDKDHNPVILTTDTSKKELIKQIAKGKNVIVKHCKFPYSHLKELDNRIKKAIEKDSTLIERIGIVSFGICDDINSLKVGLIKCNQEKINLFQSCIVADSAILFHPDKFFDME